MRYLIHVEGMHCAGCAGLIELSLKEAGFLHVHVSLENSVASFESEKQHAEAQAALNEAFGQLNGYIYRDFMQE